ncbi:MAG: FHA domain-containing protein [Spirochaetes bacterium]|nr:FHA domain-containing protein [Spirochaetota bacterium]
MSDTISNKSLLGDRLNKIQREEQMELMFKGKNIPLISKVTVGREKNNTIVIDSQLVSRHHAEIHKIKNEYFIKDMDSTNGTFVNNVKITPLKYYRLHKDDLVSIGKANIRIVAYFEEK